MPESIRESSIGAGIARYWRRAHRRARFRLALVDGDLRVGVCGDLREVGHDQHLVRRSEAGERAPHCERCLPADSRVDLVEHQRRRRFGDDQAEREHRPRKLATGGDPRERREVFARVGGEPVGDRVAGLTVDVDLDARLRQRELEEMRLHRGPEPRCRGTTSGAHSARLDVGIGERGIPLRLERGGPSVVRDEQVESFASLVSIGDDLVEGLAVLPDELPQQLAASPYLRQALGIVGDLVAQVAQLGPDVSGLGLERMQPRLELGERRAAREPRSREPRTRRVLPRHR